jgi:hypothetical protein
MTLQGESFRATIQRGMAQGDTSAMNVRDDASREMKLRAVKRRFTARRV